MATDMTLRGHRAVKRGLQLAIDTSANLRLIYVCSNELPQQVQATTEAFARDELAAHSAEAREQGVPVVSCSVLQGSAPEQILRAATDDKSDLIVVGEHRPSSIVQDLLGTTAGKILHHGQRPVLIARGEKSNRYASIVVAIDFSPASRSALRRVMEWFPQADITVLSAYGKAKRMALSRDELAGEARRLALEGLLTEVAAELGPPAKTLTNRIEPIAIYGWPEDVIDDFVRERKPGLVVLGTHGRSGFEQTLFGSVAEWIINSASCDTLAVPPVHSNCRH